jgi:hypothetical protein
MAPGSVLAHAGDMDTKRKPSACRHPIRAERALHRLRRHAIPSALVVGGVGLAAADVSVGIGWGLVLAGAALAFSRTPARQAIAQTTPVLRAPEAAQATPAAGLSDRPRTARRLPPIDARPPVADRMNAAPGRTVPDAASGPAGASEARPRSDRGADR